MRTDEWQVLQWNGPNDYAILHAIPFCNPDDHFWGGTMIQQSAIDKCCRTCQKKIPEHIIIQWKLLYER